MVRISIAVSILVVFSAVPAMGDNESTTGPFGLKTSMSPGQLTPTPEMWFYEQYHEQYDDPRSGVRQKAEFRAVQRQRRLAAMKWFGFSNTRPHCAIDPADANWSPSWSSNNSFYPWQWNGIGRPWVVVRPDYPGLGPY